MKASLMASMRLVYIVRKRNSRTALVIGLIISVSLVYLYVSIDFTEAFLSLQFPHMILNWIAHMLNSWERTLPGDLETCREIVDVLTSDGEHFKTNDFAWPYHKDFSLLKVGKGETKKDAYGEALCARYKNNKPSRGVSLLDDPSYPSAPHSYYTTSKAKVHLGEVVKIKIVLRNAVGQRIRDTVGGDFLKVRLENYFTKSSVAASSIIHTGNRTYTAEIRTRWSGRNFINVTFAQSSHFLQTVTRMTSRHPIGCRFFASFKRTYPHPFEIFWDRTNEEITRCSMQPPAGAPGCNFTGRNGEPWFCERPEHPLACEDLVAGYTERRTNALEMFEVFAEDDRGTSQRTTLTGNMEWVDVLPNGKHTEVDRSLLPPCKAGLPQSSPSGHWRTGDWLSGSCGNRHFFFRPLRLQRCLEDRTFYFLGDSTIRQWYELFLGETGARETTAFFDVWDPRSAKIESSNTRLHYRCHGQPLQNGGRASSMRYVSEELDAISHLEDKGKKLTVVIGIGPHFLLYSPEVYLKRMEIVKKAAERLLIRNPRATVIVKGTSTFIRARGIGECCLSDWLSYRLHLLGAELFRGSPVAYLDVWDMTLSHVSEDLIHPVQRVVRNQVEMALSLSCPDPDKDETLL